MPLGQIIVETTLYRDFGEEECGVSISSRQRREATLTRDVESVEDAVWALEAKHNEVVTDLWSKVKDLDEFGGWRRPRTHAPTDIRIRSGYFGDDFRRVVEHIAERDGADPAGVFFDLMSHRRLGGNNNLTGRKELCRYLADEHGIDTSYWIHGEGVE